MKNISYLIENYIIKSKEDAIIDSIIREYDADVAFDSLYMMEYEVIKEERKYPTGATSEQKRKIDKEIERRKKAGTWKELTPKEKVEAKKELERQKKEYKEILAKRGASNKEKNVVDKVKVDKNINPNKPKPELKSTEPKTTEAPVKEPKPELTPDREVPTKPKPATGSMTTEKPPGTPKVEPQSPELVRTIQKKFSGMKKTLFNRMRELRKNFAETPPGSVKAAIRDKMDSVNTQFKNLDLKSKAAGLLNLPVGNKIIAGAIKFAPQIGAGMAAGLAIAGAFKLFKNMYNKGGQICASAPNKKACLAKQKLDAAIKTKEALQRANTATGNTEHPEKGQIRLQKQIRKWDNKIRDLQIKVAKAGGK